MGRNATFLFRRREEKDHPPEGLSYKKRFNSLLLLKVLEMCEVEEIILDRGPWYRDALNRLGINFRHESFGK